jgi:ferrochelatase
MNESSPVDPERATAMPSEDPGAAPSTPASRRVGVLIVNLGTPDTADAPGVRRYLREFLSDPRVIENQGLLWQAVLNGIILQIRPRIKARDYQKIWNKERDESPLKTITRAQAEKLKLELASCAEPPLVDWAMRYGNPSIGSRLDALASQGCERILIMSLYPQYSAATTATVADEVFRVLKKWRRQPTLRFAAPYYDDRAYIEALAASTQAELAKLSFAPDVILASFHGMPEDYIKKGDPYFEHCVETMRLLRARLGLDENKLQLTFQSRFGRAKWLEPATDKTVRELAKQGVKNLAVITPGFSADCLEDARRNRGRERPYLRDNGGDNFFAVPCLNDSQPGMLMLTEIVLRELKGWI